MLPLAVIFATFSCGTQKNNSAAPEAGRTQWADTSGTSQGAGPASSSHLEPQLDTIDSEGGMDSSGGNFIFANEQDAGNFFYQLPSVLPTVLYRIYLNAILTTGLRQGTNLDQEFPLVDTYLRTVFSDKNYHGKNIVALVKEKNPLSWELKPEGGCKSKYHSSTAGAANVSGHICLSLESMLRLPKNSLEIEVLALALHELAHVYNFVDDDNTAIQMQSYFLKYQDYFYPHEQFKAALKEHQEISSLFQQNKELTKDLNSQKSIACKSTKDLLNATFKYIHTLKIQGFPHLVVMTLETRVGQFRKKAISLCQNTSSDGNARLADLFQQIQSTLPGYLSLTYDYVHGPRRSIFSEGLNINRYFVSEAPTFSNKYSGDLYADFVESKNQETVLMLLKYNCQVGHDFIRGCQVPDTIVGIDQLWSLLQSLQSAILNDEAVERNFERKEKMENDVAVELKKITRDSRWVQLTQGILREKKALHRRIPIPVDEVVGISPLEIRIALNTLSNLIQNSEALDLLYQLDIDKFLIYDRNQYLVSDTSALPVAFSYLHFGNTIDQLYEYLKTLPRRPHAQNHGAQKKN